MVCSTVYLTVIKTMSHAFFFLFHGASWVRDADLITLASIDGFHPLTLPILVYKNN